MLLVTPRYPPLMGGVENHVYQVARRFARQGVQATVLTADLSGDLPPREKSEGVEIRRVPAWPRYRDYYFAPEVSRTISKGDWDIVHLQSYHTLIAPMAMLAAWRARIPYVVTFHGGGHSSRLRNAARLPQRLLLRPLLARAAKLIATAQFEIGLFSKQLRLPRERFVLIPNGSDISVSAHLKREPGQGQLIASVGRLERYKGHQRILAALPYILNERPEARLWIAGSGPYEENLQRMAEQLGVADRVEIRAIPPDDREEMAEQLSKAGLVTLLSEYETHPMAALEALALGCPLLVATTSGLQELADRKWARSVPIGSAPEKIAGIALEQLESPLLPSRLDLPTWDDCTAQLLALYRDCIRGQ